MQITPQTIRIEKVIAGGFGLARRKDGPVLLTRFVLPGEIVLVRETQQQRGYSRADLLEVKDPSPGRVEPACPLYTRCGGCDLQHCTPETQLHIKQDIVREALARVGVHLGPGILQPVLPSPDLFHYRHRVRLKITPDGQIGFFKMESNELVPTDSCPVATRLLNRHMQALGHSGLLQPSASFIGEVELMQSPADNAVFLLFSTRPGSTPDETILAELAAALPDIRGIALRQKHRLITIKGSETFLQQNFGPETAGTPFSLRWSPACFSQVNASQNARLIAEVIRLAGEVSARRAVDLFCGMGNFSVPLALRGASVTGIEKNQEAVAWARINCHHAAVTDARFKSLDVGTALKNPASDLKQADLILLDPPRQGLGPVTRLLARLAPRNIIYVSCDPATLARDLAVLTAEEYSPAAVIPVDMFPQTHHIETVVLLEKN